MEKLKKVTLSITLFYLMLFFSGTLSAQITLNVQNQKIRQIIQQIEKSSDYSFFYNNDLADLDKSATIQLTNSSIEEALNGLFSNTSITYLIKDNKQVVLTDKKMAQQNNSSVQSVQQAITKKVTGTVTDEKGEPLPGVSVVEKGTTNGIMTDADGTYSINVKEGAILDFTYVGFKPLSESVNGRSIVNIVLTEDVHQLSEVVMIGYGSARKQDLSTSISTVKIDQTMKGRSSDPNVLLQGRVTGLTIQSAGGDPLKSANVAIRGRGSRGSDDNNKDDGNPYDMGDGILYVVDGVPNAPFNMADVETITVLKDAASAAIYGANVGSGGVIIVTTKGAEAGKAKISMNVFQGIQTAANKPKVLNAEQYNQVWATAIANKVPGSNAKLPIVADPTKYPYGNTTRTNWLDEIFRTAYQQHYDLSVTGGTDLIKALASVSYDKNEGTLLNTYKETLNAKLNVDFQLAKWAKLSQRATFQYSNGQGDVNTSSHQGIIIGAVFYPTSATVNEYDRNGNLLYNEYGKPLYGGTIPRWAVEEGISGFGEIRNPVATLERLRQYRPSSTIYSTTSLEVKPINRLTLKSDFTASLRSDRNEYFNSRVPEFGLTVDDNARGVSSTWHTNWLWETTATYAETFYDKHSLSAMAGYSMSKDSYRWTRTIVNNFNREDDWHTIFPSGSSWDKNKPEEKVWCNTMISMFARAAYSFDDRYFMTASIRRDATSKLYKDNNYGYFPAVSGSWKISSEQFFESLKQSVNLLKVRGSWGQIGNINSLDYYGYDKGLSYGEYPSIYGEGLNNQIFGTYVGSLVNRDLKWETSQQLGIGLDITLFKSFDLSVDYYNKTTKDLIDQLPVPSSIEIAPYANIGKVENKGWEFSLSYNKTIDKLNFNLWGNLSTVKNTVKDLGDREFMEHDTRINSLYPLRSAVGQPWNSYYLIKTAGIFQTQEEIDNYTKDGKKIQPNAVPGDLKFVDANGDGTINDNDKQYMGSYLPKLTYSFGGGFDYKGFDFSFMFQGISDVKIFNGFKQMGMTGRDVGNNMITDVLKSWDYDKNSGIPRLSIADDNNKNYTTVSDYFLESGAYLRLKNVTLGYTLPKSTMASLGLPKSSIRFYVSADNLVTITPYDGIDPEVGGFGLDGGNYPVSRGVNLGFNVNF